jgi:hypothetical protein
MKVLINPIIQPRTRYNSSRNPGPVIIKLHILIKIMLKSKDEAIAAKEIS